MLWVKMGVGGGGAVEVGRSGRKKSIFEKCHLFITNKCRSSAIFTNRQFQLCKSPYDEFFALCFAFMLQLPKDFRLVINARLFINFLIRG